jgi:hypothetical protein
VFFDILGAFLAKKIGVGITPKFRVKFTLICYFLRNQQLEFQKISFLGKV